MTTAIETANAAYANASTNIAGLPADKTFWTEHGYSQSYVWQEVKRTAKTVTMVRVKSKLADDWKPEIVPGGFVGHCTNQCTQRYDYLGVEEGYTITIRLTKRGWMHSQTHRMTENLAREFYDYNM